MRSLEVLDRNGTRVPKMPRIGPLRPIAEYVVQLMIRWIVRGYQNRLVTRVRKLYERREANSVWGSPEHVMLRRARINAVQVEQGYKGNQLGIPAFLLGGAILSTAVSVLRAFFVWAFSGIIGAVVFTLVFGLVFATLAWAAITPPGWRVGAFASRPTSPSRRCSRPSARAATRRRTTPTTSPCTRSCCSCWPGSWFPPRCGSP